MLDSNLMRMSWMLMVWFRRSTLLTYLPYSYFFLWLFCGLFSFRFSLLTYVRTCMHSFFFFLFVLTYNNGIVASFLGIKQLKVLKCIILAFTFYIVSRNDYQLQFA